MEIVKYPRRKKLLINIEILEQNAVSTGWLFLFCRVKNLIFNKLFEYDQFFSKFRTIIIGQILILGAGKQKFKGRKNLTQINCAKLEKSRN